MADSHADRIAVFTEQGDLVRYLGAQAYLSFPTSMAASPDGCILYIADLRNKRICVLDTARDCVIHEFGLPSNREITSVQLDSRAARLWVSDGNVELHAFTLGGQHLTSLCLDVFYLKSLDDVYLAADGRLIVSTRCARQRVFAAYDVCL